jgi:hypothetical protein
MQRIRRALGILTLSLCCRGNDGYTSRDELVISSRPAGAEEILAALRASGQCLRKGHSWAYAIKPMGGSRTTLVRVPGVEDQVFVRLDNKVGNIGSALVDIPNRAVFWFEPRANHAAGMLEEAMRILSSLRDTSEVQNHPSLDDAHAEWSTPRGRHLLMLVQRSEAVCAN